MKRLRVWVIRLGGLFRAERREQELAAELESHLQLHIEDNLRSGMTPEQARRDAILKLGGVDQAKQAYRERATLPWIENLLRDVRYALRQLYKSPGITCIAVTTLALGIGANTAVFTLTWAVILKGLPVPHPGRLIEYEMRNGDSMIGLSGPEYTVLRGQQKSCTDLLAWASDAASVRNGTAVEGRAHIQLLSGNALDVLEMQPYLGNFFSERSDTNEDARGIPVVLSYDYWQQKFHGEDHALGQTLFIAGNPATVIDVMPKTFEGLTANFHPALYLPLSFADLLYGKDFRNHPGHFGHFVLGRLKPGMTLAAAQSEVEAIEPLEHFPK